MSEEHLVLEGKTMKCLHCGFQQQVKMPETLENLVAQTEQFEFNHANCQKTEPKASDYLVTESDYSKGFDHGCDYIMAEIERFDASNPGAPIKLLMRHLNKATP